MSNNILPFNQLIEQPLKDVPLIVIDTETTGLYAGLGDRLIELAAVRYEGWREVDKLSVLVNPGRSIRPAASEVNHIYDADVADQPTFDAFVEPFMALCEGGAFVAHNAVFDAGFMGLELLLAGEKPAGPTTPILPNPWICTLQLARRHFSFGRNSLAHVAYQLKVRTGRAHRALNDVYTTAEVFKRMARELNKQHMHTLGDFLHAQGEPIYTPPMANVPLPEVIAEAVPAGLPLTILYMGDNGIETHAITPQYALYHRGTPYLIAHDHAKKDTIPFQVELIFSAESL